MVDIIELTKFDVAERQLIQAINLFFEQGDPVSIHTLAEAAGQVLRDIAPKYSTYSFYRDHPELKKQEKTDLNRKLNEARNFFKHANKDPDNTFSFHIGSNHLSILESISLYTEIKGEIIPEVVGFSAWILSWCSDEFPFDKSYTDKIKQAGLLKSQMNFEDCQNLIAQLRNRM